MGEDSTPTPIPSGADFQTQMILRQLESLDRKGDKRTGELHRKIEDHTKTLDGKITLQGTEIRKQLQEITNEQAGEKVRVEQAQKDLEKVEEDLEQHLRDSQMHMRTTTGKTNGDSAVVKVLTSKGFWVGIATAVTILIIAILKAAGTF